MMFRENQEHLYIKQGSRKVPSRPPGQVDFSSGQVTFPCHLSDGQGLTESCLPVKSYKGKQKQAFHCAGQAKSESYQSEGGETGIQIFFEPC